jgi:hypothetical protein
MTTAGGDAEESGRKVARFLEAFLVSDIVHRVRGSVMESATSLEFDINETLAAWLAANIDASDELAGNVLTRLPISVRLELLERRMQETQTDELWPLLVPVLKRVFELRNRYAHGHVRVRPDGGVRIVSWNRGRQAITDYSPDQLAWLAFEATMARTDLARLWAYWVPAHREWHERG